MWGWSRHQSTRAEAAAWTSWRRTEPRPTITDPEYWTESPERGESAPAETGEHAAAGTERIPAGQPVTAGLADTDSDDTDMSEYAAAEFAELVSAMLTVMCPPNRVEAGV